MLKEKKWYENVITYGALIIGSFIAVTGIQLFLSPHVIAPGGLSGFTIVINELFGIPLDITYILINIPLLILGYRLLGHDLVIKTFISTAAFTIALRIGVEKAVTNDLFMASLLGGVLNGLGVGLVMKYGGTTGGTDLIGAILNRLIPGLKISTGMLVVDLSVVAMAGLVEGKIEIALYSAISAYITAKVIDTVLEGPVTSKTFHIITDKPDEIGNQIMMELERGITIFEAKGMYTRDRKEVLMCVVNRTEFARVKEIIKERDPDAFVIVNESLEVLGEGFTPMGQ